MVPVCDILIILSVKEVHKQPQLDLVGWFTLGPASGPGPHVLPIHSHLTELYNESPILLLFHPESTFTEATAAGKLPLTLYESLSENAPTDPNDKAMDIDGAVQAKTIKFRELVYSVETGEAEMISVDFVARGGGNATAVEGSGESATTAEASKSNESSVKKGKGKQKEKDSEKDVLIDDSAVLDADDEESEWILIHRLAQHILTPYSSLYVDSEDERYPYAQSSCRTTPRLSRHTTAIVSLRSVRPSGLDTKRPTSPPTRPHDPSQYLCHTRAPQHPCSSRLRSFHTRVATGSVRRSTCESPSIHNQLCIVSQGTWSQKPHYRECQEPGQEPDGKYDGWIWWATRGQLLRYGRCESWW